MYYFLVPWQGFDTCLLFPLCLIRNHLRKVATLWSGCVACSHIVRLSFAAIGLSLFAIFMLEHVIVTISALIGFDKPSQFNDFSFIGV